MVITIDLTQAKTLDEEKLYFLGMLLQQLKEGKEKILRKNAPYIIQATNPLNPSQPIQHELILTNNIYRRERTQKVGYRYEIESEKALGRGGYGAVFDSIFTIEEKEDGKLEFKNHNERVIKVQRHLNLPIEMAEIEAYAGQQLPYAHIKPVVIFTSSNAMIMSAIIGKKFPGTAIDKLTHNHLQNKTWFTTEECFEISLQTLHALNEQIFENGKKHRDISSNNILVYLRHIEKDIDCKANIVDFLSVINASDDDQGDNSINPNVYYASPERLRFETTSQKSDIYSLGLILAEVWGASTRVPRYSNLGEGIISQMAEDISKLKIQPFEKLFAPLLSDAFLDENSKARLKELFQAMTAHEIQKRPDIKTCLQELNDIYKIYKTNKSSGANPAIDTQSFSAQKALIVNAALEETEERVLFKP